MRNFRFLLVILAALFLFSGLAGAQSLASLAGNVVDSSGAAVAAAAVTLTNTRTGAVYNTKTASDGSYRLVDVPPGPAYDLTIKKDGFQVFEAANLYLPVATTTTQSAKLEVGSVTQTVRVTESGSVTLDTTDTTIGNNLDMRAIQSLPNEFRDDPAQLLRLQVGTVSAQSNPGQAVLSNQDPNHTRDGSVAGARADQNNISVDGIDATDFAIGGPFATQAAIPVEAVQEFSTQVAQPSAAFGGRSGAQTAISTKSGTNDWHGSAYEFNRNAATEANTFFNNQNDVPRLALVRNQFGANVGGPVKKDKLFFFFEYDGRRDASAQSETQFVPFPHVQNGEIAYINNSGGGACSDNSRLTSADVSTNCVTIAPASEVTSFDPCSTTDCSGAQGFVSAGPAPALLSLFKNRYPAPNDFNVGDGLNTAGILFNAPAPLTENGFVTRVDYNLSSNNRLFGRVNLRNESTVNDLNGNLPIQFPGDPLTALATIRDRAWVVGDTWTISPTMINQFTVGETRANDQFPITNNPAGSFYELSFFGSFAGSTFATPYERQSAQGRVVPDPTLRDDVTLIRGKHTLQFGAQWNPVKVRSNLTNDFTFVQEGLGGAVTGLSSTLRPSDIKTFDLQTDQADNTATSQWDNFFAGDLGLINNVQAAINYDGSGNPLAAGSPANRDWRIYETAGYVQDSWKLRNDLTVSAGVRYQYQTSPYEVHGVDAQFFNTNLDNIVETRVANGLAGISGPDATPLLTYQRAGKANKAAPLYAPERHDFSPRIGVAWNPSFNDGFLGRLLGDRKTVIRAGADMLYDESVIYAITNFENQSNYLFGNTVADEFNAGATTNVALENDPRFNSASSAPFTITPPPFQNPLTPAAIFNDGIDPHLHTPYSYSASFGFQRELPGGFQLEADYYGRFGRRLLMLGDVSQAMDFTDPTSKQTLVQAFSTLENDSRANPVNFNVPSTAFPFFENQMNAALGAAGAGTCETHYTFLSGVAPSCAAAVYENNYAALQQGGTGGILPALPLPQNVGLTPQFFVDALMANEGFSDYNSLFVTLRKRLSHNLQFDFNYTFSHSIDNGSTVSNENGNFAEGVSSVMCDVTNDSACRGNSEFDATHQVSAAFVYDLPFGRGQMFGRDAGRLLNEAIGGWQISGIQTWRTGLAFAANGTDIAQFDTVSLAADTGALFTGTKSAVSSNIHVDAANNNEVQFFANPTAASGAFSPVTGLQSGSRDTLRGPHFSNLDLAVSKNFPLFNERYKLQFRAEAYNTFNHPNFGIPDTGVTSGRFGVISGLAGQEPSRVMQFALRFDF